MLLIIAILLISMSSPVFGQDNSTRRMVTVFGYKDSSCSAWVKSHGHDPVISDWFHGFVSGYNFGNRDNQVLGTLPNDETLFRYIDKFCRGNPRKDFTDAAMTLVQELREKR